MRRDLNRLSALLEIADKEFSDLRQATEVLEARYTETLERGDLGLELDANSLEIYLGTSGDFERLIALGESVGLHGYEQAEPTPGGSAERVLHALADLGISTVAALDEFLKHASDLEITDLLGRMNEFSSELGFTLWAVGADILTWLALVRAKASSERIDSIGYRPAVVYALNRAIGNDVDTDELRELEEALAGALAEDEPAEDH